ncbi:C4-dicarboxylate TRAP transporter large permease protein DctM [Aliiroseovarius sp. xm-m-379]|uniref:TRAP transporter large permease protein n=1 Tax=Aliiroseovarius crassostreae TaxID=154981 RepID=A0A0P7KN82_9RHOB|nr:MULTISPECIES: TRAP transporter large permease subunit [Aliiroseovarius]KPN63606.1 TRAP dicarboxylate transporter subunit DctM [Aliiroseovarius crassostreae]NRP13995.1 C4-dicarboxylate TRAP transporter large permease protein DctM [Aliiroseovarius sp. xm-d-517]NRP23365.1 C4-dicarboxylate TRAP transporter large permease protein DctM [Aliiroseovarius sp. xm-m-379]NRP29365.1 C4-dicarboxylate TRAP transporter large permease protein DctM [Aliiroseovarius sp. xm-m-314]NRP32164.1 C4-dicarboxylate TR
MADLDPLTITAIMFLSMLGLMALGAPLAWALTICGVGSAWMIYGDGGLDLLISSTFSAMDNFLLVALPMFIFMGLVLQRSGITDDLFEMIHKLMGRLPGGLGIGTVIICALIAAMAGVSGAATVSLGIIALPAMLKRGYDSKLVTGTIMAGGALGFLIPPSVLMIIYAFLSRDSVGKLFAAGLVPGLMLAGIYIAYILVRCRINPLMGPPAEEQFSAKEKFLSLRFLIAPGILIVTVLGCIIGGVTSPSEASAIGAFGALVIAGIQRRLSWDMLRYVMLTTTKLMGMLMWITIAAVFFSKIYVGLGAGQIVGELIEDFDLSPMWVIIAMLATYFVLGMFLDDFAIVFITVPLFVPIVRDLGFDTTWFAVLFILSMQSAYLTPPFGYNLFYMRSVAPPEITIVDIYKAALPFVVLQIIGLALVVAFPEIALWLPNLLF